MPNGDSPQDIAYRKKIYGFLSNNFSDFKRTEEEFNSMLDNQEGYAEQVYGVISSEFADFGRSKEEFISLMLPSKKKVSQQQQQASQPPLASPSPLDEQPSSSDSPSQEGQVGVPFESQPGQEFAESFVAQQRLEDVQQKEESFQPTPLETGIQTAPAVSTSVAPPEDEIFGPAAQRQAEIEEEGIVTDVPLSRFEGTSDEFKAKYAGLKPSELDRNQVLGLLEEIKTDDEFVQSKEEDVAKLMIGGWLQSREGVLPKLVNFEKEKRAELEALSNEINSLRASGDTATAEILNNDLQQGLIDYNRLLKDIDSEATAQDLYSKLWTEIDTEYQGSFETGVKSFWNQSVAKIPSLIGRTLQTAEAVARAPEKAFKEAEGVPFDSYFDGVADELDRMTETLQTAVDTRDERKISRFTGEVLGQGALILGTAATGAGVAGSLIMGHAMSSDEMYKDALRSGVGKEDAKEIAMVYGSVSAPLELLPLRRGVSAITGKALRSAVINELKNKGIKELGKNGIKQVVKKNALEFAKSIGYESYEEGLQEGVQYMMGDGLKRYYNEEFGGHFELPGWKEYWEDVGVNMVGGAFGGAILGSVTNLKSLIGENYNEVEKTVLNDKNFSKLLDQVQGQYAKGSITEEQRDNIFANANAMRELAQSIPAEIEGKNRAQAAELLYEKELLKKEIEGKAEPLVLGKKERVRQIDKELEAIAAGEAPTPSIEQGIKFIIGESAEKIEREVSSKEKFKSAIGSIESEFKQGNITEEQKGGMIDDLNKVKDLVAEKKDLDIEIEKATQEERAFDVVDQKKRVAEIKNEIETIAKGPEKKEVSSDAPSLEFIPESRRVGKKGTQLVGGVSFKNVDPGMASMELIPGGDNDVFSKVSVGDQEVELNKADTKAFLVNDTNSTRIPKDQYVKLRTEIEEGFSDLSQDAKQKKVDSFESQYDENLARVQKRQEAAKKREGEKEAQAQEEQAVEQQPEQPSETQPQEEAPTEPVPEEQAPAEPEAQEPVVEEKPAEEAPDPIQEVSDAIEGVREGVNPVTNQKVFDSLKKLIEGIAEKGGNKSQVKSKLKKQVKDNFGDSILSEDIDDIFDELTEGVEFGKKEAKPKLKKVAERVTEAEKTGERMKAELEERAKKEPVSNKESDKLADEIIKDMGADEAVAEVTSNPDIHNAVQVAVLGKAANDYFERRKKAKTEDEAEELFKKESDVWVHLAKFSEQSGSGIQKLKDVYRQSPLGIKLQKVNQIKNKNKRAMNRGSRRSTIRAAKREAMRNNKKSAKDAARSKSVKDAVGKKRRIRKPKTNKTEQQLAEIKKRRQELFDKLRGSGPKLTAGGLDPEKIEIITEIAFTYIQEGHVRFSAWAEKMKQDLKSKAGIEISDEDLENIWTQEVEDGKTMSEQARQEFIDINAEKLATRIVNRVSPSVKKKNDPVRSMLNTLLAKVDEKLGVQEKKTKRKAIDKIRQAIENFEEFKDVWQESKEIVEEEIELNDELTEDQKNAMLSELDSYFEEVIGIPFGEKLAERAIKEQLSDLETKVDEILLQHPTQQNATVEKLIDDLVLKTGVSEAHAKDIAKTFYKAYGKIAKDRNMKMINKMFPSNPLIHNRKKVKKQHEKIVDAVNLGVLEDEEFSKLFYEKYGLVDETDPEFNKKMDQFAERIFNAPGTRLKNREEIKMLNYLSGQEQKARKQIPLKLSMSIWFANILFGYETHIRNQKWNVPTALLNQMSIVALKNPKNAGFLAKTLLGLNEEGLNRVGFRGGVVEASAAMKEGVAKSTEVRGQDVLSRLSKNYKFLKFWTIPGRALQAGDVLFNVPLSEMKQAELLLREMKKQNRKQPKIMRMSNEAIEAAVNEVMGYTSTRFQKAQEQAGKEVRKFYKIDEITKDNKQAFRDFRRRTFEIMEETRAEVFEDTGSISDEMKENIDPDVIQGNIDFAKKWADTSTLLAHPKGTLGYVAHLANVLGRGVPASKYVILTFVNAPFNIANSLIDRSPLGFIRIGLSKVRGRRGSVISDKGVLEAGLEEELHPDEEREMYIKAIGYTMSSIALYSLTKLTYHDDEEDKDKPVLRITGPLALDFSEAKTIEKGTGLEPYTVYFMNRPVIKYKDLSYAPLFLPVGMLSDYDEFGAGKGEESTVTSRMAVAASAYMRLALDQTSFKSVNDLFSAVFALGDYNDKGVLERSSDFALKQGASIVKSTIVPNFVSQANNDVRALMGMDAKRAVEWHDYFYKDLPIFEEALPSNKDHLGRPVKDVFDIPLVPVRTREDEVLYQWDEVTTSDPYYRTFVEKGYRPRYFTGRNLSGFVDKDGEFIKETIRISKTDLDELNERRGQMVLDMMNIEVKKGVTRFDEISNLDDDSFKKAMNKMFSAATKRVKTDMFFEKQMPDK